MLSADGAGQLGELAQQYGLPLALALVAIVVLWRHSNTTTNRLISALEAQHQEARAGQERQTLALAAELTTLRASMETALGAAHTSSLRQQERLGDQAAELVRHEVRLGAVETSQQDLVRRVFAIEARDRHG